MLKETIKKDGKTETINEEPIACASCNIALPSILHMLVENVYSTKYTKTRNGMIVTSIKTARKMENLTFVAHR